MVVANVVYLEYLFQQYDPFQTVNICIYCTKDRIIVGKQTHTRVVWGMSVGMALLCPQIERVATIQGGTYVLCSVTRVSNSCSQNIQEHIQIM